MAADTSPRARRGARNRGGGAAGVAHAPATGVSVVLARWLYPALLLVALLFLTITTIADPDVWFHLALGREVVESGTLPRADIFSFTAAGREWISSGWLSSVLLHLAFSAGSGPDAFFGPSGGGLVLVVFVVMGGVFLAIHFVSLRHGAPGGVMALLLLASALGSYMRYNPRPDLFSQALTGIVLLLMVTAPRTGPAWRLWALPALFALWPNLHAGFMVGLLPVAVCLTLEMWRWHSEGRPDPRVNIAGRMAPMALCFVAWMANPYGPRITALAGKIAEIPEVTWSVYEWMPLVTLPGYNLPWPMYAGLLALAALAVAALGMNARARAGGADPARHPAVPLWVWVTLVLFTVLALYQRRQAGILAIAVPALLAPHLGALDAWFNRRRVVPPVIVAAAALVICGMKVAGTLEWGGAGMPEIGRNCRALPCATTEFLAANPPPGNMFNSYGIGGYLLYHLAPRTKVFIDGRLDVYDHATWRDLLDAQEKPAALPDIIARHDLRTFVVDIREWDTVPNHIAPRLDAMPGMRLVHFDDNEAVFVRATPESAAYAEAHGLRFMNPFRPATIDAVAADPAVQPQVQEELQRVIGQSMGSAASLALAARAARVAGDTVNARRLLEEALARDPENPGARAEAAAQGRFAR